jgi:hypothetical protein
MRPTQTLPDSYHAAGTIDVAHNPRLLLLLNIAGLILMAAFGWLFVRAIFWLRPSDGFRSLGALSIDGLVELAVYIAAVLALLALHIIIHEAIHGIFFWIFTRSRPRFALRFSYAYAAAPGWYIPRNRFLVTTLAPFVFISLGGVAVMPLVPASWLMPLWFILTMNASGSVGDLLVAAWLLRHSSAALAEDRGDAVTLYTPERRSEKTG